MENLLKQFKIELIKQDLTIDQVANHLKISKPTLYKRMKNPGLLTLDNLENLKKLKLNIMHYENNQH